MRDWRLPENRREMFQRFYSFHLKFRTHPGCVYFLLPEMAEHYNLDADGRAWLVWLNGNTQNPVTTQMLLEAAPNPYEWPKAVKFWDDHFKDLEWDTDRRHQKSRFNVATEKWAERLLLESPAEGWARASLRGWPGVWEYSFGQPYMGRLSAWSMAEYARILLPGIPDADTFLLRDKDGSRSHRNGLGFLAGHDDAVYWEPNVPFDLGIVGFLEDFAEGLLSEAQDRNPDSPDVSRLTMESALCTYKSWHKPNRRYPNVYADMHYTRVKRAEGKLGRTFTEQWDWRARHLPDYLRLEASPGDPGLVPEKQNHYLNTGEPIMMHREWPDLANSFNERIELL
jgi:hypothetical protein